MLCPSCGTDTPAPLSQCRQCSTPLPAVNSSPADMTMVPLAIDGPFQIGDRFGRYRILKLVGAGGMGQVYHAWDEELSEAVALKVIRREFADNEEADARFKRELSVARQVTHTNVVRIHDLGTIDGVRYISMPFIEGIDLASMLASGRLPQDVALSIARQLAAGLAAAHRAGVVHRDLKPGNVMVDRSGHVFLMDFGLARSTEVTQLTQTGMLIGTVEYMAPEQARGEATDFRSDIYTLGLILFELFTGGRPFTGETPMSRLTARLHKAAPDPRASHPDVPPYLAKIVLRCLERDPAARYQTIDELVADLEGQRAARRIRFAPPRRLRLAAGAVAVFMVLAAGGYVVLSGPRESGAARPGAASARVTAPAVSLAILPFENASGDPTLDWLGTSLGEVLATGVGQSAALHTISGDRVHQLLRDLHMVGTSLDTPTLRRIADLASADTVVSGRYVRVGGDQVRIEVTVHDFTHGRTTPFQVVAPSRKDVLRATDDLVRSIQQQVAASPDVVRELRATSLKPSSMSVEAVHAYTDGLERARQGDYKEAEARLRAATEQDPRFALAYSQLGLALSALGRDNDAQLASRRAVDLSDNLPARERYLVRANDAFIRNDNRRAIEAYENLANASPEDADVRFTLAGLYEAAAMLDKAREGYARVLATEPRHVEALLSAGRVEIKRGNPAGAVDFLNRGLSQAIQLDNDEEKGRILHAIGIAYKRLNKPEDALRYYQEALVARRKVGQPGGIAATLGEIAEADRMLGRPDEALATYNEALRLQRQIGDKSGTATNLLNLAAFLGDRGRQADSLKMLKESLQLHRDLGDATGQALCLNNIGSAYFAQGQYDDALTYFQQALQLREKLNVPDDIAETLHNVGESAYKMGQYDQALTNYVRALQLYRNAGNKQGSAIESYATGKVFKLQGRYAAALAASEDAVKIFRASGERTYWMACILGGYGDALALVGRSADADTALDEALGLARDLNNQDLIAQILSYQGDRRFYSGDYKAAASLFEQAARAASRTSDGSQALLARFNLEKVAVAGQRVDNRTLASLRQITAQADRLGLKQLPVQCSLVLGEALLQRRQAAQARPELEGALARSEKLGLGCLLPQARYLLARTLRSLGQEADASLQLQEARRLVQSARSEAGDDAILRRSDFAAILTGADLALAKR